MNILEFISQPWHWSISGFMIVFVMFLLLLFGGKFGASSNLRTLCSLGGAGSHVEFFNFDWKSQIWNLVFIFSAIIGGYVAVNFLSSPEPVDISLATKEYLSTKGIAYPNNISEGMGFVPFEIYSLNNLASFRNLFMLIGGGFLVGFGTRYAGGCTSGHAISGLSNLQVPSLIAVVGFFIGGLIMTWFIMPILLTV